MELESDIKVYNTFSHLLEQGEADLPHGVKKTIDFFTRHKLWFQLSRNHEAHSCRDAASKRRRLGHVGIPLSDELKSFFGKVKNNDGNYQFVVIHCRANDKLDQEKLKKLLNSELGVERLSRSELSELFSLEYGRVNPFTLDPLFLGLPILQVFDNDVLENRLPPYTMMTNAGDLTFAIEFKPNQLIRTVAYSQLGDIVERDVIKKQRREKIGILTGNGPESGIHLWTEINEILRRELNNHFYGDVSFAPVIVESVPEMGLSMELDTREEETWKAVSRGITSLCAQGATICCIACNTTQYFTPKIQQLCAQFGATYVSLSESLEDYLHKNNIAEFDFLGIKYVTDFEKWSAFKDLQNKYAVVLPEKDDLDKINELAFKVKKDGITGQGINKLRDLLNQATKTQNVVLALTEISILMSAQKRNRTSKNYIDTLQVLAEEVAYKYIAATHPEIYEDLKDEEEW